MFDNEILGMRNCTNFRKHLTDNSRGAWHSPFAMPRGDKTFY